MKHISLPATLKAAESARAVKRMVPESKDIAFTSLGPSFHIKFFFLESTTDCCLPSSTLVRGAAGAGRWQGLRLQLICWQINSGKEGDHKGQVTVPTNFTHHSALPPQQTFFSELLGVRGIPAALACASRLFKSKPDRQQKCLSKNPKHA